MNLDEPEFFGLLFQDEHENQVILLLIFIIILIFFKVVTGRWELFFEYYKALCDSKIYAQLLIWAVLKIIVASHWENITQEIIFLDMAWSYETYK